MGQLVAKYPQELDLRFAYVRLLMVERNWAEAQLQLDMLIKTDPLSYPDVVPFYVHVLNKQNSAPLGLRVLQSLLKKHPKQDDWREIYARQLIQSANKLTKPLINFSTYWPINWITLNLFTH